MRLCRMSCARLSNAQGPIQLSQYLFWAALSALRTLALSHTNWYLAALVFLLGAVPFSVNVWVFTLGSTSVSVPRFGCISSNNETRRQALVCVPLARAALILSDLLTISVTLWYTATQAGGLRYVRALGSSLSRTLVQNGAVYFLLIVALNAAHLVLTLLSDLVLPGVTPASTLGFFIDPLTAILICRLLIALQSANQKTLGLDSDPQSVSLGLGEREGGSLRFAERVMGSIGEVGEVITGGCEMVGGAEVGEDSMANEGGVREGEASNRGGEDA
ncbi:hypothetical protein OH77DRAFT_942730 [Trametes cingulata]|nr:hypothetical protein OH77DRAFT_942730 [Trametes cingulata]